MALRIATAPVSWGILEVEGWARQKSYGEVLDEMVEAGYTGTELGPSGFLPTDPELLNSELRRRRLALIGAFVPLPLAHTARHAAGFDAAITVARLLAAAGAPFLVLADQMDERRMAVAGSVDEARDGLSGAQWEGAAGLVSTIAAEAVRLGLRTVFHHHAGTFVETPGELDRLLALTAPDQVGVCLDTGHYFYGGGDPLACVRRHRARIWHLHLKDVRPDVLAAVRREKVPYLEAIRRGVFCELGEGGVALPAVIHELLSGGFDGWAVFEQDVDTTQPGVNPKASAARSRTYLRRAAGV